MTGPEPNQCADSAAVPRHVRGQHKIALTNHCRLASETINPRFRASGPGHAYSTVLTVNSGYE